MIPRRLALLIPIAALVACGGGRTIRVAPDDASDQGPVALAPEPEPSPEAPPQPSPEPAETTTTQTAPDTAPTLAQRDEPPAQGYSAYGNAGSLDMRRIGQWTRTGIAEARRLVIRDANAWAEFWSELGVGDRPEVDFTQNVVVAVAAGQRPSGGYEISVGRVSQHNGELTVEVIETTPGPNCMTSSSLTQPVDVVVVPTVAPRGWSFVERKEVRGCR
jgi:hypothetical protein